MCKALKFGRSKIFMTEENERLVALTFVNSPKKSMRRASQELSIPRSTLRHRIDKLKLKPYRPRLVFGLLKDDPDRRLQFHKLIHVTNDKPDLLDKIIWFDKACLNFTEM